MGGLIDFEALGEVCNNLVNKLSEGVGWIANRETPGKIAIRTYIEDIQNSNYDPVTKAALISNAKKTIKEYCNQHEIVKIAMGTLSETAKPSDIDNDWLAQFMDKARLVSDENFRLIWGRILALECNEPNTIPRGLLHVLEQMDKKDAENFLAVCSVSVYTEHEGIEFHPIIIDRYLEDFYSGIGITYNTLVDLQALGLIETSIGDFDPGYQCKISDNSKPVIIRYFDKQYELPEGMNHFSEGNVIFSRIGQTLCRSINADVQEGFWEKCCIPMWEKDVQSYYSKQNREQR